MATVAVDATSEKAGYISWGAAIAGALIASALSFVLLTFGSAVGLSLVSPWTSTASSAKWAGALAVFWIVAQQIGSFLAGGYVAGRMRTRWHEAKPDETEFRDGLHGALVWAVGAIIGAMLAASVASSVVSTAASALERQPRRLRPGPIRCRIRSMYYFVQRAKLPLAALLPPIRTPRKLKSSA